MSPVKWLDPPDVKPTDELKRVVGGHPLLAEILARRGFDTPDLARAFLDPDAYTPSLPTELPGVESAAQVLLGAIQAGKRILVWGDFDVDGQTATALLIEAIEKLGGEAEYIIPHRMRESHGIRPESLRHALERFPAEVLVTCDTGISEVEAIEYAVDMGLTVVLTDHHELPRELPPAHVLVNPHFLPDGHPLEGLPGVGVAYQLAACLYDLAGRPGESERFLDLVALGIVADVAPQIGDTRYLLQRGLDRLRVTDRLGLMALMESSKVPVEAATEEHIAYQLAPRLNAIGRLAEAGEAVRLLITNDPVEARLIAERLEGLNAQRRFLTGAIYASAMEQIASDPSLLDFEALVLGSPRWHPGVIGIVAGRLADRYERPTVLLAVGEDGVAYGSARSVPGYDIGAAIGELADMLIRFGGHEGAAGLSLPAELIPRFRRRLSKALAAGRRPEVGRLMLDAWLPLEDVTLELAQELQRLGPFGEGNPPIRLATRDVHVLENATFGAQRTHRRLVVGDEHGATRSVVWWNGADRPLPDGKFDLAYTVHIGRWRDSLQLRMEWLAARSSKAIAIAPVALSIEVIDRRKDDPYVALSQIRASEPNLVTWAEGLPKGISPGLTRLELTQADAMVIFTAPPDRDTLARTLEQVRPARVYVLAADPGLDAPKAFLRRLLGLAKYAIAHKGGEVDLMTLASALANLPGTVRRGLGFLEAIGKFRIIGWGDNGLVTICESGEVSAALPDPTLREELSALLNETRAFRAYMRHTKRLDALFG